MLKYFRREYWLHEKVSLYLRTGSVCLKAGGVRNAGSRGLPQDGDKRVNVLPVEEEICGDGSS
jgi:hypothetical protein